MKKETPKHKKTVYSKYLEYFNFKKEAQILDVCCVTDWKENLQSLTEDLLANKKFSVTGVDLRSCKIKKENFKFTKNDILNVSFKKDAFDYIICSNALQLIGMRFERLEAKAINASGDKLFLDRAYEWIKPGGKILIDTTVSEIAQVLDFTDKISWRVYTIEELQEMLTSRGFKIIHEMAYDGAKDTKKIIPEATGYLIIAEKEKVKKPKKESIEIDEEIIDEE